MSDFDAPARDDATGQFTSNEPLFGKAREEADAGFKPMTVAADDPIEFENSKEAGDILAMARQDMPAEATPVEMQVTATGEKAPANETMSVEQAAMALSAYRDGQNLDFAKSLGADFAAEIDRLRGDAPAEDGEPVEAKPKAETPEPAAEPKPGELDAEIAKALKHPQVREAIEQEIGKAAQAHQQLTESVNVAHQFAVASFLEHFPELAQAPENLQANLELMSQLDPERFNSAMRTLTRVSNLQQEQVRSQKQKAEQERQQFAAYKQQQNAKCDEYGVKIDERTVKAGREYFAELGFTPAEMSQIDTHAPYFYDARFQKIVYDAIQYRIVQQAKNQAVKKPVPHVSRPGTARSSAEANGEHMSALSARLASSGSLKDAVALRQAQIRSRG